MQQQSPHVRKTPERLVEMAVDRYHRRQIDEAIALFDLALTQGADPHMGAGERWMAYMLAGRFEHAWRESDRVLDERRRSGESCADRPVHLRWVWDGSPLAGRSVLVRCYHGLGDSIQFLRYVPRLRAIARSVAVQATAPLLPLLRRLDGVDRLIDLEGDPEPAGFEAQIEATELPFAFRTTLETIPCDVPYLSADPAGVAAPFHGASDRLQVGIVWASGLWRPERNLPLAALAPLRDVPGVDLHCLQRGPCLDEVDALSAPFFSAAPSGSDDIEATAALIASLDLVISTDTMVAHLAGALGKPVWTLLHFHADWRWLATGSDSPWYLTMRLFRQRREGEWAPVVAEVTAALAAASRTPSLLRAASGREPLRAAGLPGPVPDRTMLASEPVGSAAV